MHIDHANLNNLTQLWQRYGARVCHEGGQLQLRKNVSWPNRTWVDMTTPLTKESLRLAAENTSETTRLPLWPELTEDGSAAKQATVEDLIRQSDEWEPAMQHTAMALQLGQGPSDNTRVIDQYPLRIKRLSDAADIARWVAVGSKAFGYVIDTKAIMPLLACEDIQLLLAYDESSQAVATGLLFKTGNVAGIHQIGVPSEYRGKGYATQMMRFLIRCADSWKADYAVLQASTAGKPVYQKLGFVEQFLITYLQKAKN